MKPIKLTMQDANSRDDYIAPQDFWLRQNGKKHTYRNGKTEPATLAWCIHNINREGSTFKLDHRTLPTYAADFNCSIDYLIFVTLRSKYKDTRFGEFCYDEAIAEGKQDLVNNALCITEEDDQPANLFEATVLFLCKNGLKLEAIDELKVLLDDKEVRDGIRTYLDLLDAQQSARAKNII